MQELHQGRVEGLLVTITGLEDRVDALERMSVTTDYAAVVKCSNGVVREEHTSSFKEASLASAAKLKQPQTTCVKLNPE